MLGELRLRLGQQRRHRRHLGVLLAERLLRPPVAVGQVPQPRRPRRRLQRGLKFEYSRQD